MCFTKVGTWCEIDPRDPPKEFPRLERVLFASLAYGDGSFYSTFSLLPRLADLLGGELSRLNCRIIFLTITFVPVGWPGFLLLISELG